MRSPISDHGLIELIEAGDREGLGVLYDRHGAACLKAAGDVLDISVIAAEDLVFDVFLKMWRDPPAADEPVREFLLAHLLTTGQKSVTDAERGVAPAGG